MPFELKTATARNGRTLNHGKIVIERKEFDGKNEYGYGNDLWFYFPDTSFFPSSLCPFETSVFYFAYVLWVLTLDGIYVFFAGARSNVLLFRVFGAQF